MAERTHHPGYPKTAACACGALTVTVTGPPRRVHACCCLECQRRSGSAFSYTSFFDKDAVSIAGEHLSWRRSSDAGRIHETNFCPVCGNAVFYRLEGWPAVIAVPVGNFADPAFEKPAALYWTIRRHEWLAALGDAVSIERQ